MLRKALFFAALLIAQSAAALSPSQQVAVGTKNVKVEVDRLIRGEQPTLWLSGEDLGKVTRNASQQIGTLTSRYGSISFIQGTDGSKPSLIRGTAGRWVFSFDGSADTMTSTSIGTDIWGLSGKTSFVVAVPAAVAAGPYTVLRDSDATTKSRLYIDTSKWATRNYDGSNDTEATHAAVVGVPALYVSGHDGTNISTWLSRGGAASVASGATSSLAGTLMFGAGSAAHYFSGNILEVIIFNRVLPVAVREQIRQGLREKWGA